MIGIGGDAGIHLVHLGAPDLAIGSHRVFESLGPVLVGIEGHFPVFPLLLELPAPLVGVGEGALAFDTLLACELGFELFLEIGAYSCKGFVAGRERGLEKGLVALEDGVEVAVLGDALPGDGARFCS